MVLKWFATLNLLFQLLTNLQEILQTLTPVPSFRQVIFIPSRFAVIDMPPETVDVSLFSMRKLSPTFMSFNGRLRRAVGRGIPLSILIGFMDWLFLRVWMGLEGI